MATPRYVRSVTIMRACARTKRRNCTMALIELHKLGKTYDLGEVKVNALRTVSLKIEKGEFVALIGPSGSGKSTLMNTLGCLDRPSHGRYRLEGVEVGRMSKDQLARLRNKRIGFVFQNFNLLARTTALENVEVPMLYDPGTSRRQRRKRAKELLDRVGLGDRLDHKPNQLSGGQQQRVAIARALVNHPSILLCDEPTGNLDTRTSREIMAMFRDLNKTEGLTIILVTHDLEVARQADRAIVLVDGDVVARTPRTSTRPRKHCIAEWSGRMKVMSTRTCRVSSSGSIILCRRLHYAVPGLHEAGWRDEQRTIATRDPASLPPPLPKLAAPVTVADTTSKREDWNLSLNEAVRITLENAKAVRVFTGLGAPTAATRSTMPPSRTPHRSAASPLRPGLRGWQNPLTSGSLGASAGRLAVSGFAIGGSATDLDHTTVGVNKLNALGGRTGLNFVNDHSSFNRSGGSLNPQDQKALELSYTQPLLQGGGFQFNQTPIVLARLDTERSYFQFKDATQELVRGTIEGYWNLVQARLDLWAREIQFEQADEAYKREDARKQAGIGDVRNVAQANVTLNQFGRA